MVERVCARLHQEREDLVKTMEDFTLATDRWSTLEQQQLSHSIKKLGTCMDNCATAVNTLVSVYFNGGCVLWVRVPGLCEIT